MRNILLIELAGAVGLVVVTGLKADDKKVTFGADTLVVTRSVYMSAAALQVRLLPFLTPQPGQLKQSGGVKPTA